MKRPCFRCGRRISMEPAPRCAIGVRCAYCYNVLCLRCADHHFGFRTRKRWKPVSWKILAQRKAARERWKKCWRDPEWRKKFRSKTHVKRRIAALRRQRRARRLARSKRRAPCRRVPLTLANIL